MNCTTMIQLNGPFLFDNILPKLFHLKYLKPNQAI